MGEQKYNRSDSDQEERWMERPRELRKCMVGRSKGPRRGILGGPRGGHRHLRGGHPRILGDT